MPRSLTGRLHRELHRRGIARVLNTGSNNWSRRGTAYIQTRGPRWAGRRLWRYALRHSPTGRPDWLTVRVTQVQRPGRWTYRWHIAYERLS